MVGQKEVQDVVIGRNSGKMERMSECMLYTHHAILIPHSTEV